jgi:sirohydrochlorin cobaltochelatase
MEKPFEGVILIAHGARDVRWMEPFIRMRADLIAKVHPQKVALAFMEFATPTFADAVTELYTAGARRVLVAPIFLSGGGHVAKDIPELVNDERERHPGMTFVLGGAIGEEREVVAGMLEAVTRLVRG